MIKRGFFKNKRAEEESSSMTWAVIGMIVASVIVVFLVMVIIDYLWLFGSSETEKISVNSFENLAGEVSNLLSNNNKFSSTDLVITIGEDYMVAGFDTDWKDNEYAIKNYFGVYNYKIFRPTSCNSKACLCLFKKNKWGKSALDRDNGVVGSCAPFEGNIVFLYPKELEIKEYILFPGYLKKAFYLNNIDIDYKHMIIYGSIRKVAGWSAVFGTRKMYIEKFVQNPENKLTYIYASHYDDITKPKIFSRSQMLSSQFGQQQAKPS